MLFRLKTASRTLTFAAQLICCALVIVIANLALEVSASRHDWEKPE
jgi:hypothetical protein